MYYDLKLILELTNPFLLKLQLFEKKKYLLRYMQGVKLVPWSFWWFLFVM